MKNFSYLFYFLTMVLSVHLSAQQDPHFSMYRNNMNIVNPGYAGTNGGLETLLSVRSQWVTVEHSPETFNFNINTPIKDKVGVGFSVVSDKVFVLNETHLYADFSYRIQISTDLNVYAGLKAGGSFLDINLNSLGITDDPLFTENTNSFNPNVGIGFYLKAPNYYVTLSAPGLLKNDRFQKEGLSPSEATDDVPFYIGGGYDFEMSDSFVLKPSVLVRALNGVPLTLDLSTSGLINDRIELGGNYRLDESFTIFTNVSFMENRLLIGYAYEITTTDFGNSNNYSSHEVLLKYKFRNSGSKL